LNSAAGLLHGAHGIACSHPVSGRLFCTWSRAYYIYVLKEKNSKSNNNAVDMLISHAIGTNAEQKPDPGCWRTVEKHRGYPRRPLLLSSLRRQRPDYTPSVHIDPPVIHMPMWTTALPVSVTQFRFFSGSVRWTFGILCLFSSGLRPSDTHGSRSNDRVRRNAARWF
jgi:hypothetical protein